MNVCTFAVKLLLYTQKLKKIRHKFGGCTKLIHGVTRPLMFYCIWKDPPSERLHWVNPYPTMLCFLWDPRQPRQMCLWAIGSETTANVTCQNTLCKTKGLSVLHRESIQYNCMLMLFWSSNRNKTEKKKRNWQGLFSL